MKHSSSKEKRPPLLSGARALSLVTPIVFVTALAGALAGREPFHTWFFSFAWWSLILFIDAVVYRRRGESLLLSHPARFAFFAGFSVALWFLFEALNLRLGNWSYQGLPSDIKARWAGYLLGFATVVPALMETSDFLETCDWPANGAVSPLRARPSRWMVSAFGGLLLTAALIFPKFLFPLIWVAFIPLVDPWNDAMGAPSLGRDWREGSARRVFVLGLAGLLCGLLWEALNMAAGARWVYHLPGLESCRIFEMPLPGYLGFPLFAIEVFVLSAFAVTVWDRSSKLLRALYLTGTVAFVWSLCGLVDRLTAKIPS